MISKIIYWLLEIVISVVDWIGDRNIVNKKCDKMPIHIVLVVGDLTD